MKMLIFSVLFFTAAFSYAGGSQVGTLKTSPVEQSNTVFIRDVSQIKLGARQKAIYAINSKDGITELAVANAVDNKWDIQKYAVPDSVIENSEFSQFIDKSAAIKEWIEIQSTNP